MRGFLGAVALSACAAMILSGCATSNGDSSGAGPTFQGAAPSADVGKGVIRGVVVDIGIHPLPGVHLALTGPGVKQATNSSSTGSFSFGNLQPGTYFIFGSKAGYKTMQQSTQVVADDPNPPVVKMLLDADASAVKPFVQAEKWNGYLECALSVIALCGATNNPVVSPTNDNFNHVIEIDTTPTWIQSEVIWQTTTAASNELWLWHSQAVPGSGAYNGSCNCWAQGPSPLVMISNETMITGKDYGNHYGTQNWLYLRMFTGSVAGTRNPLNPEQCYPGPPVGDVYCGGVGFSLEQPFTVYTHIFYGFKPPAGWQFSKNGEPKPPA
jgi:hypothetical protein